jgi:hypothetical protein
VREERIVVWGSKAEERGDVLFKESPSVLLVCEVERDLMVASWIGKY